MVQAAGPVSAASQCLHAQNIIVSHRLKRRAVAKDLRVSQPRVSDLFQRRTDARRSGEGVARSFQARTSVSLWFVARRPPLMSVLTFRLRRLFALDLDAALLTLQDRHGDLAGPAAHVTEGVQLLHRALQAADFVPQQT